EPGFDLPQAAAPGAAALGVRQPEDLTAAGAIRSPHPQSREVRAPLISIFKRDVLGNTLSACVWLAGGFVAFYSVNALFATHLQKPRQRWSRRRFSLPISARSSHRAAGAGGPTASAGARRRSFRR